jgi:3-methylcrotonyl-CoA carboxylase alpha subunit
VLTFAPPRGPGVRVDAGITTGDEVTMHYDPMLAKLIVSGTDRLQALDRLLWALDHTAVLGVATNLPLLRAIAAEPDFRAGQTTTAYLETHELAIAGAAGTPPPQAVLVLAACWEALTREAGAPARGAAPYNPWTSQGQALQGGERRFHYSALDGEHSVVLTPQLGGAKGFSVTVDGAPFCAPGAADTPVSAALHADGAVTLSIGARRVAGWAARREHDVLVSLYGESYTLRKPRPLDVETTSHAHQAVAGRVELVAPMAGTVIKVNVAEGDTVAARQTLVVLGAMKMEHAIVAPHAGRVVVLPHAAGDVVPGGALLVELAADDDAG